METVRERPAAPLFTRASVFIAGRETAYRHAGRGRPVLVLAGDDSTRRLVADALTAVARVIMPERIEGDDSTSTASWIRGLLDGLGLEDATVVADEPHGLAAITLALADPFGIERVALLVNGESLVAGVGIEERLEFTGQRLLVVGMPAPRGATDRPTGSPDGAAPWIGRVVKLLGAPD